MTIARVINIEDIKLRKDSFLSNCDYSSKSIQEPFVMGPISLAWLSRASQLPGKALHLALAAAHQSKLTYSDIVQITPSVVKKFGIDGGSKLRALTHLLSAGLIEEVEKKRGKSATIRLVGHKPEGAK